MATQPFAAPDEASHYLRALTITNGHILGPKVPYPPVAGVTPTQMAWADRDTRAVLVPARLSPPNVHCLDGKPDRTGSCLEATPNGNFPPLAYLLPAVALSASNQSSTGLWLTRVASALPSLALLVLALVLLWSGTGWSLVGLLAATTPMVLFSSSVLNSSGVEITACLAFAAAVLRITRRPSSVPGWVWVALAVTGAIAILSWPLGLVFVLGDLVLFAALLGRQGAAELISQSRRRVIVSGIVLVCAGVLSLIYSHFSGLGADKVGISPFWSSLHGGLDQLRWVLRDAVGTFGALTVSLPLTAYRVWWLLVLALLVGALWLGALRDRLILIAVTVLALLFPVLFYAWFDRFTGFGVQGREVLPPLMLIPLVAGEIIYRRRSRLARSRSASWILTGVVALIAVFQAYAWWYNARAAAEAPGTLRFYAHAHWSPPLGWIPWIILAALGTLLLLSFGINEGLARPFTTDEQITTAGSLQPRSS
jgi:hypothetical protein